MFQVTNVEVHPLPCRQGLVGFASVVLDDAFKIDGIAIYTLRDGTGYRTVYPDKRTVNGHTYKVARPLNREAEKVITDAISDALLELLGVRQSFDTAIPLLRISGTNGSLHLLAIKHVRACRLHPLHLL